MEETQINWPAAYIKIGVSAEELINLYGSKPRARRAGNCVEELVKICEMLDIEPIVLQ